MKICSLSLGMVVLMTSGIIASPAFADRNANDHDRDSRNKVIRTEKPGLHDKFTRTERHDEHNRGEGHERDREYRERGYKLDSRYNHNHYYPPRGYAIRTLPKSYRVVPYHGVKYYFNAGVWYRRAGLSFSVILPPVGIVVPVLPPYYTRIWVGATPYYYADGIYYVWSPPVQGYKVVEAPDEDEVEQEPALAQELFIYPKQGQSQEQQDNDRYECYRWAADKSGFDPTQPGGNVPVEQHETKRADYQRAMTACLEGRGYSVK